ncbi:MAG: 2-C-methyl-D-erythritol 4-phosphate cytidylyltransferase [Phycisphaeraceae bacterium]|nr:2-C-methyl-D-erythritol 4-phosphate cytidylyltransferase [Phycisphaeraceae bacterium]
MRIAVILPAAGAGVRFGERNKLEEDLAGRPVFVRAVELFVSRDNVAQVVLAVDPDELDSFTFRHGDKLSFHGVTVVPGGKAGRWETVTNALGAIDESCTHIAVHDAARPLTSRKLVDRVFDAALQYDAVIPAVPVSATLKRVTDAGDAGAPTDPLDDIIGTAGKAPARRVIETVGRAQLVEVQTPQVFEAQVLRRAYARITDGAIDTAAITDDAGLIEALGEPVYVVEGESTNLKITRPEDLDIARAFADSQGATEAATLGKKRLFGDDDDD